MSATVAELEKFIDVRLASIFRRPSAWGSDEVVEQLVLQLLEMRRVVRDPSARASANTHLIMSAYDAFIAARLPSRTPDPLAVQLARSGRRDDLIPMLSEFAAEQQRELASLPVAGAAAPTPFLFPLRRSARGAP